MAKYLRRILIVMFAAATLAGCGGGGTDGGGAVYDTVTLKAEYAGGNPFDSDVAKHTDATPDNCGVPGVDSVTILPDSADFTITSTAIPDLPTDFTASDVRLQSVTITYVPASTATPASPAIPAQNYALGNIIPAGGSATISLPVASQVMKSSPPLSNLVCGGLPGYSYYVTVTFNGVEVNTNKTHSFVTNFSINFADFID